MREHFFFYSELHSIWEHDPGWPTRHLREEIGEQGVHVFRSVLSHFSTLTGKCSFAQMPWGVCRQTRSSATRVVSATSKISFMNSVKKSRKKNSQVRKVHWAAHVIWSSDHCPNWGQFKHETKVDAQSECKSKLNRKRKERLLWARGTLRKRLIWIK